MGFLLIQRFSNHYCTGREKYRSSLLLNSLFSYPKKVGGVTRAWKVA